MRVTASANLLLAADAAHRIVTRTVQIKKTADLTEGLFTGTWTDVTAYLAGIPSVSQRIEYSPGQFVSDNISLTGNDIEWWKANVFNATDYIELRIRMSIGTGAGNMSTDELAIFSGIVDTANVEYNEIKDTVTFSAYTLDDLGDRISAEKITTQYIDNDADGSGTDGLILPNIPGMYVTDANVSSFVLKKGMHMIEYEYNGGTEQARLDDGDWVTLPTSSGTATLINGDGDEKITIYVRSTNPSQLSNLNETLTDYIVVLTAGDTIPYQPMGGMGLRWVLKTLYENIGLTLTSITCDTLQFASHDAGGRFSYYDIPPQDIAETGRVTVIDNDGTDLFVAVGDTVYRRDMTAETSTTIPSNPYTALTDKSGYIVTRLWYNARNNDLWVWFTGASTTYVRVYHVGSATYDEADIGNNVSPTSSDLIDYNYLSSNYMYGLVYTDSVANEIRLMADDATTSELFDGTALSATIVNQFVFNNADKIFFRTTSGSDALFHTISVDVAGSWDDDGGIILDDEYLNAQFPAMLHKSENVVYYGIEAGGTLYLKSHTTTSGTATSVTSFSNTDYAVYSTHYANSKVYYIRSRRLQDPYTGELFSLASNAVTTENVQSNAPSMLYPFSMTFLDSVLYGLSRNRQLWRYSATINMYLARPVWQGMSIKAALSQALQSYNLLGKISSQKKTFIYRRGNDDGDIQTTGNSVAITVSDATDITQIANAFKAIELTIVTNGDRTVTYDGTTFNSNVFSDARTLEVDNPLWPSALLEDIAAYFFEFYSSDHDTYRIPLNTADIQYEVMDGAAVTFATTKIQKTATGLIMAQTTNSDASVECEVLF